MTDKNLLDWDALLALKAVSEKGTLKGAADALNRVPSAISYQTRKLEQQVGAKLLEKTGKRVIFTPAGRTLMKQIPELMDNMQQVIQTVQQVAHGWEASLIIGVEEILPMEPVIEVIQTFNRLNAPTTLHLRRESLAGTWDAAVSGRCDIVIGAMAPIPQQYQLKTHKLPSVQMVMTVSAHHPLAEADLSVDEDVLEEYPMIVLTDTAEQMPRRKIKVRENPRNISISSLHDKLQAHLAGLGYGWLPKWMADPYIETGELVVLKKAASPELFLTWRKTDKGRAIKWFVEHLSGLKFE